ncbi:MAG: PQQ-like beta-propeller repeat protein [Rhodothermaceae bacterium]|nr:PQQ-like beta-propeller repeat protein [Rhodothermaceae bacterium]
MLYVGRGDGKLYAVHPETGAILWRYRTFNPQESSDPDGGGEIVTAPLIAPNGTVYFGTWGEGRYETNAFYAVNPDGTLRWRWPATTSLEHRFYASPALSPDASTVYASTFTDEAPFTAASLYAFHRSRLARQQDRLKWSLTLEHNGAPVFTTTLAVGSDGTVYVGGYIVRGFGTIPVVAAIQDRGADQAPVYRWDTGWIELANGAQFTHGIALREEDGQTTRLYATTANLGTPFHNGRTAGELYAVDPTSGAVLALYDPSDDDAQAVGSLNSPAIGANGTIYVGVRGRYGQNAINGRVLAVDYDATARQFTRRWSYEVDGHIEWNHPAIGPDGGLYLGISNNAFDGHTLEVFEWDEVPDGSTCTFYGLRGPRQRLAR